ncbi:alpha/beta hydrolase family protein [Aquibacillus kalidii]|uniref:alpha/beta hydrolase family protein n=1 Tax=Aquibacillus kalidii TaxID=2762597 RepID=UPI0016484AA3|nr:alpha/beta hydrolase [Aquibacillus kalidii]
MNQEVVIQGQYQLSGTLSLPDNQKEKHPLIVMVHGSGDLDRDENTKRLKINAFKEISDVVVKLGFATLRYDKRGVGSSEGDFYQTGLYDLINDGVAAVRFGKNHPSIDEGKVIILGHSEGSIIAPAIFEKEPVQGMILLAGSAEPLADTTKWQREEMKRDMRTLKGFEGWILRVLKVDQKIDKMNEKLMNKVKNSTEDVVKYQGKKINAKWDREHQTYNVAELLPMVTCPVLVITGSKDVQVKPEQVYDIARLVSGESQALIVKDLTHMLRKTEKEHRFSVILKDYKDQVKQPLDKELIEILSDWLLRWNK